MSIIRENGIVVDTDKGAVIQQNGEEFLTSLLHGNRVFEKRSFATKRDAYIFALLWVDQYQRSALMQ